MAKTLRILLRRGRRRLGPLRRLELRVVRPSEHTGFFNLMLSSVRDAPEGNCGLAADAKVVWIAQLSRRPLSEVMTDHSSAALLNDSLGARLTQSGGSLLWNACGHDPSSAASLVCGGMGAHRPQNGQRRPRGLGTPSRLPETHSAHAASQLGLSPTPRVGCPRGDRTRWRNRGLGSGPASRRAP